MILKTKESILHVLIRKKISWIASSLLLTITLAGCQEEKKDGITIDEDGIEANYEGDHLKIEFGEEDE